VFLATVEPGQEVVICDPVYAELVNRIRLAGGVPRFVRSRPGSNGWATDPEELAAAVGPRTAVVLTMSPTMPTEALRGREHWDALAEPVARHCPWILNDAAMERIRFDGSLPGGPCRHLVLEDARSPSAPPRKGCA
jgi:aspartate/methionine/tyrosine aminotransferase